MKNIIEMIKQIGVPVKLETIKTWNPNISERDIIKCKDVEIVNGMVGIKKASLNIEELTFDQLIELIHKYNDKIKADFKSCDEKQLKLIAMKKWLNERYEEVSNIDKTNMYETFEVKRKGNTQCYVICDDFNEEIGKELMEKYSDEDLTICSITRSCVNQLGYFRYMEAKEIITQNIDRYRLKTERVEIYKIEKE